MHHGALDRRIIGASDVPTGLKSWGKRRGGLSHRPRRVGPSRERSWPRPAAADECPRFKEQVRPVDASVEVATLLTVNKDGTRGTEADRSARTFLLSES